MNVRSLPSHFAAVAIWIGSFTFVQGQLISYWPFEDSLNDCATDGGHADHGSMLETPSYDSGVFGQALVLDGGPAFVEFASTIDMELTGDLSVSLWLRLDAKPTGDLPIFAGGLGRRFRIFVKEDPPLNIGFAGGGDVIEGGPVTLGRWHHLLAVSQSHTETRLYLNGEIVAHGRAPRLAPSQRVFLGGNPDKPANPWPGVVDDLGVFHTALTDREVEAITTLAKQGFTLIDMASLFESYNGRRSALIRDQRWEYEESITPGTFFAIVLGRDGSGMVRDPRPQITQFEPSPLAPSLGDEVKLSWTLIDAESVSLEPSSINVGNLTTTGSVTLLPDGITHYTLTASNAHGETSKTLTVYTGVEIPIPRLSEWLASPAGKHPDEDGDHEDWIEIYNPGPLPIPMENYFLSDDRKKPRQWRFPNVHLSPDSYLVVWASGKDRRHPNKSLHTNFKLDAKGESLTLTYEEEGRLHTHQQERFPRQARGHSSGPEGMFAKATPGEPNVTDVLEDQAATPWPNIERGHYEAPFEVILASDPPQATIRYTFDGSDPSSPNALVYHDPIPIARTTTLRAVADAPGYALSETMTHTYLFLKEVVEQPWDPQGFPLSWGNLEADYEMDPRVVFDPRYEAEILADFLKIPMLSVVMDRDDLFHPDLGIYAKPNLRGRQWERSCSVEWMDSDSEGFQVNGGVRIRGGAGRGGVKKSFHLAFRRAYGPSRLEYPMFPGQGGVDTFDSLILRAGSNHTWHHRDEKQARRAQYLRDEFVRRTQLAMGHPSARGRFAHLFLNGLYWGVYNVTERPDDAFAADYLGGEKRDWIVIRPENVDEDEFWFKATGHQQLDQLRKWVDVTNLADYIILNSFAGNRDWDWHNWFAVRRNRLTNTQCHFFSWDAEISLDHLDTRLNKGGIPARPTGMHADLLANDDDYKTLFITRLRKHFGQGGALTSEKTIARYQKLTKEIESTMVLESARWGDASRKHTPYVLEDWRNQRDYLLEVYFPQRSEIVLEQFKQAGLKLKF